jgi:hypothetical protein
VLARVGGAEGEFTLAGTSLGDDTVVVVKRLLDSHEDASVGVRLEALGRIVPYFGVVVAWCASALVFWQ